MMEESKTEATKNEIMVDYSILKDNKASAVTLEKEVSARS
jgi:hypothetical protein